ncbi:MAG: DUF433 domain-containing protein [Planctomycetaceae bacterium]
MYAEIIDRGRGPEIAGTRITVFCIMDWLRDDCTPETIATQLRLSRAQVDAAIDYIKENGEAVERDYAQIVERARRPNPERITSLMADSPNDLKQRIIAKRMQSPTNVQGRR